MYGKGVYFAVNAQYSARGYSQPDASGTKRMYVARVLTGRYTKGEAQMKNPPPRANDPTDRYDSLVDNCQKPNMFVIFHDDQAYPEYLITFNWEKFLVVSVVSLSPVFVFHFNHNFWKKMISAHIKNTKMSLKTLSSSIVLQ